jgi:hypothetical protein
MRKPDGVCVIVSEAPAESELQMQDFLKDNPEMLPVEELGLPEPLLVVGRESPVASGAIDLLGVVRTGDILIAEFKTGPQNPDFRCALAQMVDYGAQLWQMSYEDFEEKLAARFFASQDCIDMRTKGRVSLKEAAEAVWSDVTQEEVELFQANLAHNLATGTFHFVLVAQRFTATMRQSIEYVNTVMTSSRFFGLEMVRFLGPELEAFEARTVIKPAIKAVPSIPRDILNKSSYLDYISDSSYREALNSLFLLFEDLGLRFSWGTAGVSVRIPVPGSSNPVTIGWFFPPNKLGWMGLRETTLGYDPTTSGTAGAARNLLDGYKLAVQALPGTSKENKGGLKAVHLESSVVVSSLRELESIFRNLVSRMNDLAHSQNS